MKKLAVIVLCFLVFTGAWWDSDAETSQQKSASNGYATSNSPYTSTSVAVKKNNKSEVSPSVSAKAGMNTAASTMGKIVAGDPAEAKIRAESFKRLADALKRMSEQKQQSNG